MANTIYLTSGTQWTVPMDWNNNDNYIECYGAGASGDGCQWGAGGGAGAWAKRTNLSLTAGSIVTYQVGAGGPTTAASSQGTAGGDTWFNGTSYSTASCAAPGGARSTYPGSGQIVTGGVGGQASICRGGNGVTVVNPGAGFAYSGGNGGTNNFNVAFSGSGGGGAAGPGGNGSNGGANVSGNTGGAGGNGSGYPAGGAGAGGTGGANTGANGGNGGNGGPGGGGGGGGVTTNNAVGGNGGNGGVYGAGGGAGGFGTSDYTLNTGGSGGQGIIVIGYNPPSYKLPASGPVSFADIANTWYTGTSPTSTRSLGDPEIRYLLESGTFNYANMPLPALSNIDFNDGRNKPIFSSTTATFSTAGTYTFYLPAYKFITVNITGAGGGQGGWGYRAWNPTASCDGKYLYACSGANCGAGCTICNPYPNCAGFQWTGAWVYYYGGTGSTGGTSSISYNLAGGTSSTIVTVTGGTGGQGWTSTVAGTNGSATFTSPYTGTTSTASNGGTGGTSTADSGPGGNGGAGGRATFTIHHGVTTGYPVWANTVGVTTLTLVVGTGGAGGVGAGTYPSGNSGGNGTITINWI